METRAIVGQLSAETATDNCRKVTGYAAVFDCPTYIRDARGRYFSEVVKPGAFRNALAKGADVRALYNHDANFLLGRTRSGTLRLAEDSRGLSFELDLPEHAAALAESIRRGDLDGCSFGFTQAKDHWGEREGMPTRELHSLDLVDVSLVVYPAYQSTSLDLRSVSYKPPQLWKPRLQLLRATLD